MDYPSRFEIGELVELRVIETMPIRAFVRAITFTSAKVRYALFIREAETTLHNIDSAFVHPVPEEMRDTHDFGADNYS